MSPATIIVALFAAGASPAPAVFPPGGGPVYQPLMGQGYASRPLPQPAFVTGHDAVGRPLYSDQLESRHFVKALDQARQSPVAAMCAQSKGLVVRQFIRVELSGRVVMCDWRCEVTLYRDSGVVTAMRNGEVCQ